MWFLPLWQQYRQNVAIKLDRRKYVQQNHIALAERLHAIDSNYLLEWSSDVECIFRNANHRKDNIIFPAGR